MQNIETYYRSFLQSELQKRIDNNSAYSLRAFSRDLNISPQMLSDVLNQKKDLSIDSAAEVTQRLSLATNETQAFIDSVMIHSCKSDTARRILKQRFEERFDEFSGVKSLNVEIFKVISNWYHLAILELVKCDNFKYESRWMAATLGININELKEAIQRLKMLELLEEVDGNLVATELTVSVLSDIPAPALREHARQVLSRATCALEEQEKDDRDITSITMAIDPSLLPEAKNMILKFRRKLCKFLESGEKKEVYTFAPILFRITKKKIGDLR